MAQRAPLAALRERAVQSLRLRFVYDLANGAGLGLLAVAAVLGAGHWEMLDRARLLWLLLFVPLAHTAFMALQQALLARASRAHYQRLFAGTELLLSILSAERPGAWGPAGSREEGQRLEFRRRLATLQQRWQEFIVLAGGQPLPPAWWVRAWPFALGLAWAVAAAYFRPHFGLHAVTPAIAFLLLAIHASACQRAIARDVFLLSLAGELDRAEPAPLHSAT